MDIAAVARPTRRFAALAEEGRGLRVGEPANIRVIVAGAGA